MTVQNQVVKNVYRGNGKTNEFPFTFAAPKDLNNILVFITDDGGKAQRTEDFELAEDAPVVIYPKLESEAEKLAPNQRLTIYRRLPYHQLMNLVNQGEFFAENIEATFDDCVMQIQQLAEEVGRAVILDVAGTGNSDFDPTVPYAPGKTLKFSNDGSGLELTDDPAVVLPQVVSAEGKATEAARNAREAAEHTDTVGRKVEQSVASAAGSAAAAKQSAADAEAAARDLSGKVKDDVAAAQAAVVEATKQAGAVKKEAEEFPAKAAAAVTLVKQEGQALVDAAAQEKQAAAQHAQDAAKMVGYAKAARDEAVKEAASAKDEANRAATVVAGIDSNITAAKQNADRAKEFAAAAETSATASKAAATEAGQAASGVKEQAAAAGKSATAAAADAVKAVNASTTATDAAASAKSEAATAVAKAVSADLSASKAKESAAAAAASEAASKKAAVEAGEAAASVKGEAATATQAASTATSEAAKAKREADRAAAASGVDLSPYARKVDIPTMVTDTGDDRYMKKGELPDLTDYAKKAELPDLTPYAKKTELPNLTPYAKTADIPALVTDTGDARYMKKGDMPSLSSYATWTDLADPRALLQRTAVPKMIEEFGDQRYQKKGEGGGGGGTLVAFDDLTPEQKAALRGPKGDPGEPAPPVDLSPFATWDGLNDESTIGNKTIIPEMARTFAGHAVEELALEYGFVSEDNLMVVLNRYAKKTELKKNKNGWAKLDGGLILQWGVSPESSTDKVIRFPVAFPSKCLLVFPVHRHNGTAVAGSHTYVTNESVEGFETLTAFVDVQVVFIAFGV